ncbi:MlaC/ttg2D family ABC transporter substrate-binding protein [Alteromonas gilva]|uniref:ABC transporter substrate-binding protein n=1 Tax=Alteromonas gilva TaxID=2987522 RepID=A0ABT5KZ79_9ALTE|nr:ABC transporter substrate-binding protein [Alteromonas gilva]MDC8830073.1 ABC transporter substrate-binding protein [Alteromonas gilva]
MKAKLGVLFTLMLMVILPVSAQENAVNTKNPYEMVEQVGNQTFERIKASKQQIAENPEILRDIMEEELLPYIDYRYSAFKVLGKHFNFKKADQDVLIEYIRVFRQYLVTSYADALSYYDDQEVLFAPSGDFEDDKSVTVRAIIRDGKRPDINVAFKVRNTKGDEWKAYDMVAEGISMLQNEVKQYEQIIRTEGIEKVIELMRQRIAKPIELKSLDGSKRQGNEA